MKQRYLITNVVYGDLYLKIFLEQHLRSVLDDTNLPAIAEHYDVEYLVYTDNATRQKIESHPNFKRLQAVVKAECKPFDWTSEENTFNMRYSVLMHVFHESVRLALEKDAWLTAWVADLVVARDFFPKIMSKMEQDHDAVFVLPMRTAFESMAPILNQTNRALQAKDLFNYGYANLHPLWTACEWRNKRFTKLPFSMLWSTPTGIMARSFSITPIVFKPTQTMLDERGMIDGEIPGKCIDPYWCTDWTDAPVIGVEPLFCYYPTFSNRPAKASGVKLWARQSVHPTQFNSLKKRLYYPDQKTAKIGYWQRLKSNAVIKRITL